MANKRKAKVGIKGQGKVSKKKFGISTVTVNPNDPEEMKKVIGSLNDK